MVAPVVTRLSSEIAACSHSIRRAELTAELACYLARAGDLREAARLTDGLRADFGGGSHARVSVLIMLIEALRFYFADRSPCAFDRLRRACLISAGIRDRELVALSEAWMAQLCFRCGNYVEFGQSLRKAFDNLDEDNLSARCRLAITLASSFLLSNDHANSRYWYAKARDAAVSYGDQAAIGAITYNRAAIQVHVLRTARATGVSVLQDPALVLSEVDSAINYQRMVGLSSLDHLLCMPRLGALLALGRYADANALAERMLASAEIPLTSTERVMLAVDHALCRYELADRLALGALFADDTFVQSCSSLDAGERMIVFGALSARGLDRVGTHSGCTVSSLLDEARVQYWRDQELLNAAIRDFACV